jgi:hypothetical protein
MANSALVAAVSGSDFGVLEQLYQDHGSMGSTETFDVSSANVHRGVLDANCTFTFTGASSGRACALTLHLVQDATGSRTVTWPASVDWPGGTAPVLSTAANAVDVLTLHTVNGGTTWYGFAPGLAMA